MPRRVVNERAVVAPHCGSIKRGRRWFDRQHGTVILKLRDGSVLGAEPGFHPVAARRLIVDGEELERAHERRDRKPKVVGEVGDDEADIEAAPGEFAGTGLPSGKKLLVRVLFSPHLTDR